MAADPVGRRLPMVPTPLPFAGASSPCEVNACRACCFATEMPLLDDDMVRLETATGEDRAAFSVPDRETDGRRLRNVDGHCFFLGPEGCKVYEARPAGCRLYPLVWEADAGAPVLDDECPYRAGFRPAEHDVRALKALVDRLLDA